MRRATVLFVLLAVAASYAGGGFTVTGGIAKAVGEGSDEVNLGINFGGSIYGLVTPEFGLGGEFRWNRWTFDVPDEIDLSLQYYEFLFSPVFIIPFEANARLALQPGIGMFNGVASISYMGESDSDSEADFGISLQGQLVIVRFVLQPAFKIVFTEGETTKWFDFNVGYQQEF
ncbi:MAG: hypothetical protein JW768_06510 [Chitinispirillaceae bacterium]|nr:hypothetical protein [Chitinispirillaceae bacterium]